MRTLAFPLLLALAGCAALDAPPPLSGAQIVELARAGRSAPEIIAELERTATVLPLSASDIVNLHEAGVPEPVLDYLQRVQIDAMLWEERNRWWYGYPGFGAGFYTGPRRIRHRR
jgi:hypothetical protein